MAVSMSAKKFWGKTPLSGKGFLIKGVYRQKGLNKVFDKFLADREARRDALLRLVEHGAPAREKARAVGYAKELLRAGKDSELWDAVRNKVSMRHEVGSALASTLARHEDEIGELLYRRYIAEPAAKYWGEGFLLRREGILKKSGGLLKRGGVLKTVPEEKPGALVPSKEAKPAVRKIPAVGAKPGGLAALRASLRGIFGPRLPKKLRRLEHARMWGALFSDRWVDAHENLSGRYEAIEKPLPEITSHYIKSKIRLGNRLATLQGKEWKEGAKTAFDDIVDIRRQQLYPLAMLPFRTLKAERRAYQMKKSAEKISKTLIDMRGSYRRMLQSLRAEEKGLSDNYDRLMAFRKVALSPGRSETVTLAGGKQVDMKTLLNDLDSMKAHMRTAKRYLEEVRRDIDFKYQRAEAAATRMRWGR